MTIEIIADDGRTVVQRSQNLRAIINRAHKIGVAQAHVYRCSTPECSGQLYIVFTDRSWCRTRFADFTVCRDWCRTRWKRWGLYAEVRNSDGYWSFI